MSLSCIDMESCLIHCNKLSKQVDIIAAPKINAQLFLLDDCLGASKTIKLTID